MSSWNTRIRGEIRDVVFDALSVARRRRILGVLLAAAGPLREAELVRRVVAAETGRSSVPGSRRQRRRRRTLQHVHLPALANASLVDWTDPGSPVSVTDHPIFDQPNVDHLLSPDDRWDDVYACLAVGRRRHILARLDVESGPLPLSELATDLDAVAPETGETASARSSVSPLLHHVDLPRLDEVGLVSYDRDARSVALADDPWLATALDTLCPEARRP